MVSSCEPSSKVSDSSESIHLNAEIPIDLTLLGMTTLFTFLSCENVALPIDSSCELGANVMVSTLLQP